MKPTDEELISTILSLPKPALAEILSMVGGVSRRAATGAPALPGAAARAAEGAGIGPRSGTRD